MVAEHSAVSVPMYNRQLEKLCRTRLDDVLLDEALVDRVQVEDAQAESEVTGRLLSQILFERELLDEWDLAKLVARHYTVPYVDVTEYAIPLEALALLPADFCQEHCLIPIETFGSYIAVAVCEMPTAAALARLQDLLQSTPFVYVGVRSAIARVAAEMDAEAYVPKERVKKPSGAVAGLTDGFSGGAIVGRLDLPPISMRLGYSMHARGAQHALPLPSLRSLAPGRPATDGPAVAVPASTESGDGPAAWQEIFDLGEAS